MKIFVDLKPTWEQKSLSQLKYILDGGHNAFMDKLLKIGVLFSYFFQKENAEMDVTSS